MFVELLVSLDTREGPGETLGDCEGERVAEGLLLQVGLSDSAGLRLCVAEGVCTSDADGVSV